MKKIVGAWFGFLFSVLAAAAAIVGSTDQQDKGMNGLQKMIVEMLDGPIDDRKIRALKTYAATNGISESTLVSTVENLSEKRLLEFGPRPLESYWACASVWSVIESLGSIEFLPFLEKQSNSQFEQYHEHAERVYVLIAGIDAEPFLYKKFKSEDYVWSQSPQKHFFGFLRQEERKNPSSPKVNSGYALLIEQAIITDNLYEANFLDDQLCNSIPGYDSSTQRKQAISRFVKFPYKAVSNPFLGKKEAFEAQYHGKRDDLSHRFSLPSTLKNAETLPFTQFKGRDVLERFKSEDENHKTPWYEIVLPEFRVEGYDDIPTYIRRIREMLPVSKFFRIHWYAPLPYKMERPWTYIASEKKIGEFLSTLFCLHSLFGLSTADSLFVFDHGKTWTEDDVLVCRGTLTRIPHTSAPTHLKTQMHFDDGSTNFWFDTNCSLSSDGKYTSWYPHSRTQYGLEFPRERLRISTFSQIDHSVVDCITAIRFQVQNLPPCEYTFKSDLRRPLHTINIQYNGMWSVECIGDEQKDCK